MTVREFSVALLTVNCTETRRTPLTAVMVVVVPGVLPPVTNPVCRPIVATLGFEEDQVTAFVTTRSPPGLPMPLKKVSSAAYCCVAEGAMSWSEGATRSCLGPPCAVARIDVFSIRNSNSNDLEDRISPSAKSGFGNFQGQGRNICLLLFYLVGPSPNLAIEQEVYMNKKSIYKTNVCLCFLVPCLRNRPLYVLYPSNYLSTQAL